MDHAALLRASAQIVWEPPFAAVYRSSQMTLVRYPMWMQQHCQAHHLTSNGDADAVIDEALEHAGAWGRDTVWFCALSDATPDPGLEPRLLARGGVVVEELAVLARPLSDADMTPPAAPGILTTPAVSPELIAAWDLVSDQAFENDTPNTEDPLERAAGVTRSLDDGGGVFVTMLDGQPAASGGLTSYPDLGVSLLWGGSSRLAVRGRGTYRANLAARLAHARKHGMSTALVKGRLSTSAPILRSAGFEHLGDERVIALAVPAGLVRTQSTSSPST